MNLSEICNICNKDINKQTLINLATGSSVELMGIVLNKMPKHDIAVYIDGYNADFLRYLGNQKKWVALEVK